MQHCIAITILFVARTTVCQTTVPWTSSAWTDFGMENVTFLEGNFLPGWNVIQASPDLGDDVFGIPTQSLSGIDGDAALWFYEFHPDSPFFGNNESAALSLSGFVPGRTYTLEFSATIVLDTVRNWDVGVGDIEVNLNGADADLWQSTVLEDATNFDGMNVWVGQSLSFTALNSTVEFRFNESPIADDPTIVARFGIDGMRLVPAPGSAALLALGGLAAIRRRR